VEFSSARQSARKNVWTDGDANHMEVCKPKSPQHPSYELLRQFIITCREEPRESDPLPVEVISSARKRNSAELRQGKDSNNSQREKRLTPARGIAPLTCEL
jgi:hypothetical protein